MAPANTDEPRGFWPAGRVLSMRNYAKGVTAIYRGDMVGLNAGGLALAVAAGNTQLLGAAMHYAAASASTILVCDDPDQTYYVQDDGDSATLAATDVNLNADHLATVGNGTLLKSQQELDANTNATTAAGFRILGKHPDDSWGKRIRILVRINEHAHAKKLTGF